MKIKLYMRNLSLGRRNLVNAYEVKAGIGVIAGNTVWSMPERLECEVLQKARYINTITFTFTLKPQSNGPLYSNMVIGTLAVDGWAVIFGTARRGMGGLGPRPAKSPPRCTKCDSPPINGQCTNFILFDVAI